ncbi:hypothetical protein PF005_g8468 [Phytophthora fragariae]|uniref:Uncharacterized protein n=1 Tax=Phytophthora fragariae TaxID=53985 RepID=A0A6A3UBC5_9STRA|nr:hypothetical protein PF003_g15206 [Phytophthora fragariae]KAE8943675.1 hypothetical protein PF009_g6619 [Phytophthora fragariae]KAE9016081.1 hypothetical protein PF011_g7327 [Phytophthora fragariae]KAE9130375.1 hypothetical protein PF007_g4534 [Phytophthora fragariae]KAE9147669.1 hypothetical protein PF006_g7665 [Phytophthora fragariae]
MVYSSSRVGSRTLIKAAVVCALSLSAMPSASAQYSLDASTATDVDVCGISDGDKSVGIRVIDDSSCASGGLGCYNEHCRFCKILETPQSSVYENCKTFDVDFPTMAPLVASTGTCEVSSGDAAVGISAVTDASCLYGGLGCFNDHCRYCKMFSSVQGAAYMDCTLFVTGGSTSVADHSGYSDEDDLSGDDSDFTDGSIYSADDSDFSTDDDFSLDGPSAEL